MTSSWVAVAACTATFCGAPVGTVPEEGTVSQPSQDQAGGDPPLPTPTQGAALPGHIRGVRLGRGPERTVPGQLPGSPGGGRAVPLDSPASPTKTSWGGLGGPSPTALYTLMRIS